MQTVSLADRLKNKYVSSAIKVCRIEFLSFSIKETLMPYQPIENYGLIGNMRTTALVGMGWFD